MEKHLYRGDGYGGIKPSGSSGGLFERTRILLRLTVFVNVNPAFLEE
jgi:hypothetical protein